jgi:hypothetical protein
MGEGTQRADQLGLEGVIGKKAIPQRECEKARAGGLRLYGFVVASPTKLSMKRISKGLIR